MSYGRFRVLDWMALSNTTGTREGWMAWAAGAPWVSGSCEMECRSTSLPPLLRRRITPIGQKALRAAHDLAETAREARFILCSRHGEFSRTLELMRAAVTREAPSPADFTLSVHHALAGLLSIAANNMAGHTAIAGGLDTFGCAVLEALGCLAAEPQRPVLLIYYDATLPGPYAELDGPAGEAEFAFALLLSSGTGDGDLILTATPAGAPAGVAATQQAKQFLSFLLARRAELISPGERMDWHWFRAAQTR
jgi:hypothetical protein